MNWNNNFLGILLVIVLILVIVLLLGHQVVVR